MTASPILIAGIGNIFLGDDGFGVEVAQRLLRRKLPEGVRVVDFGIRGMDLVYALLNGYKTVILVDASARGGQPGTLYVIEPEIEADGPACADAALAELSEMHNLDPVKVVRLARVLGKPSPKLLLIACEPEHRAHDRALFVGLSRPVREAVDEAVSLVETIVAELLSGMHPSRIFAGTEHRPSFANERRKACGRR